MSFANVTSPHARRPIHRLRPIWLLLAVSCWLSAVSAQPFPSFLLDTVRVIGPDQSPVGWTASAFQDSAGLVVWASDYHVKGCLVTNGRPSREGACTDISGNAMGHNPADRADVASSGDGYLVVWQRDPFVTIYGAVLSPDGRVLRRVVIADTTLGCPVMNPCVAFDGTNYLVAWEQWHGEDCRVLFTRVSPSGEVLNSPPLEVRPAGGEQQGVSLCFGESCYVAVYLYHDPAGADAGVWCARILPDGTVLDSAGIPIRHRVLPGTDNAPAVTTICFDGRNFVVGWVEYDQAAGAIRAARVTPSGTVLDPEGFVVDPVHTWEWQVSSACVRDTTLLVWVSLENDTAFVSGRRISSTGQLLDTSDILITPPRYANHGSRVPYYASVSRCGSGFLVAYDDYVVDDPDWHGSRDLLCRRVTVSGQVLDTAGVLLSYAANGQMEADVASDGQDFFSVWTDLRSGSRGHDCAVYGLRFSAEGEVLDPTGFRISQWKSHAPSIAYGADCHLVAWLTDRGEDSCDVWARRISREGVPLDAGPIRLPSASTWSCYSFPDVAYGDSIFLVVWYECNGRTRGARVAADGVLLDTVPLQLDLGNLSGSVPQVVSDGHDFLVAMIEKWFPSPVYAMRVGSNGQLLDTTEIILGRSGTIFDLPIPQVAFGAGVYLVTEPVHSKAWRVTPAGVVLDSVIHPSGGFTMWPNVGYDGTNFLLAGAGTGGFDARGLYGRRISPGGVLLDSVRFTLIDLSNEPTYLPYMGTRLISNSLGIVGLVMTTFESDPYVSTRVRVSVFPAVTGATCEPATAGRQKKPSATIVNRAKPFVTTEPAALLDITGRKLLDMLPGSHDLSRLSPGIYLMRTEAGLTVAKLVVVK